MNVSKVKLNLSEEKVQKIIKNNPDFYRNKGNAISTYKLVSENSKLVEFKSNDEKTDFGLYLDELKKAILLENKELFAQKFVKVTFEIASCLKKSM